MGGGASAHTETVRHGWRVLAILGAQLYGTSIVGIMATNFANSRMSFSLARS